MHRLPAALVGGRQACLPPYAPLIAALLLVAPAAARAQETPEVQRLEREAEAIKKQVEGIRGLRFTGPVKMGIQSRDELRKFVVTELEREMPDEEIRGLEKAYKKLGFLGPGQDLKKILIELYTEQIAGFYNPELKELFLVMHGGPEQPMLMAHELTHALQDQHFDLFRLQKAIEKNDDRSLALSSVIEGEATVVMVVHMARSNGLPLDAMTMPDIGTALKAMAGLGEILGGGEDSEVMKTAPKVLTETLMFSYVQGASFVQRMIKSERSWRAADGLYRDLPASSEQIMHPEKFAPGARDEPMEVALPDLSAEAGPGWKLLARNVMGEFLTGLLFRERLPEGDAARAAAGWGGDAWQALEGPAGEVVIAWVSEWDTAGDAREFDEAYRGFVRAQPGPRPANTVARAGRRVWIVDGIPATRPEFAKIDAAIKEKVATRRGYAPAAAPTARADGGAGDAAAAAPFSGLRLPEDWTERTPEDPAVRRAAAGPDGVELSLIESAAAAKDSAAAARLAQAEAMRAGAQGALVAEPFVAPGLPGGALAKWRDADGTAHARIFVVRGGRQHVLALRGSYDAVEAAFRALRRANEPAARPRPREREPQLF